MAFEEIMAEMAQTVGLAGADGFADCIHCTEVTYRAGAKITVVTMSAVWAGNAAAPILKFRLS
jgi:hypothetical protein